jgi:hypothetical protein
MSGTISGLSAIVADKEYSDAYNSIVGFRFQKSVSLFSITPWESGQSNPFRSGAPLSASEPTSTDSARKYPPFLVETAVFIAAMLGRMPAMGAWWNADDWGQLGRSAGMAGLASGTGFPARWLSQHFYWDITWPLFGLDSDPHALIRLVLHGVSAVLVTRIGARAGLGHGARMLAGLLFAASPLAFTPLYWASGIQELLAAFFALLAVERWLAAGEEGPHSRRNLLLACLATILSMLSKEAGLGLPFLFLAMLWLGIGVRLENKAFAWAMVMFMLTATVIESVLVMNHFAADSTGTYATGNLKAIVLNLCVYGWWLVSPGPILASKLMWIRLIPGGIVFILWLVLGIFQWRQGRKILLLTLVAALLSLAPVLVLKDRFVPYLAYLAAAAGSLGLVSLLPARWSPRYPILVVLAIAATIWGFTGMQIRLANRNDLGLLADPVVRGTSLSWQACRTMSQIIETPTGEVHKHLTIYRQPIRPASAERAERMGERWVNHNDLYNALHGTTGPEMVLGPDVEIVWVNGLTTNPPEALVVSETSFGIKVWGQTWNALLYAALTDIGLNHFERARRHLVKAAALNKELVMFIYDEGQMIIPMNMVLDNKEEFIDWTVGQLSHGASPHEVGGVQDMFFNLLSSCTGRTVTELTSGSHLISGQENEPTPETDGKGE